MFNKEPIMILPHHIHKIWGKYTKIGRKKEKIGETILFSENSIFSLRSGEKIKCKSLFNLQSDFFSDFKTIPFIIKKITTTQPLSIQVHPFSPVNIKNDPYFRKDETWIILKHKQHSRLMLGTKKVLNKNTLISSKNYTNYFNLYKIQDFNMVHIPAGLAHSIGKNITLIEIQTNNSTTFRFFDFERKRKINKDYFLNHYNINSNPTITTSIKNKEFNSDSYKIINRTQNKKTEIKNYKTFHILIILEGKGTIEFLNFTKKIKSTNSFFIPDNTSYTLQGKINYLLVFPISN